MGTNHDSRAGPGAQKGSRGLPCKAASTPDQPPAQESASFHANASGKISPTVPPADLPDARLHGASGDVPEALPGGAYADWHEVDGRRTRIVILRVPDGGRLSRAIQDLLLDGGVSGPPLDDHDGLSGVRGPRPVSPCE